jgi:glycosyltransferase involved in cell wall biosynthesis
MKVLFLIPHVSDGGAEKILSDLSFNLELGELSLVVFERKQGYPFQGRLISMELPIEKHSPLARCFGFLRRSLRFKRLLRKEHPDCVVSFMGEANFINALVAPRPVLTVHNHLSSISHVRSKLETTVFNLLLRTLYRRATIVAVSEAVKDDLVTNFGIPEKRIVVIRTAVETDDVQRKAAEEAACPWDRSVPVIVTAGRLHPQKGQWHLLRAFAEVRKQIPCRLAILGTGELEGYLRDLAKDLGIETDVYFMGWQANPFKFLARGDVFILPSVSEGLPLVLLEAMACRLPVIATDCPGSSREIVSPEDREECGLLVPAVDERLYKAAEPLTSAERAMADAILRLLRDPALREKLISAGLVRLKDFNRATYLEKYRQVIRSASG